MGAIISRWRKKPSTIEILEQLDKEISEKQKLHRMNVEKQRRFIASLILYSVLGYILCAIFIYCYYLPNNWPDRLKYLSPPFILFPLLIWITKKILHWYFVKRITQNESALEELKEKKKSILEEVMENETYKKAKEILEKFDPDRFQKLEEPKTTPTVSPAKAPDGQELRHRGVAQKKMAEATPAPSGLQASSQSQPQATPLSRPSMPGTSGRAVPHQATNGRGVGTTPGPMPIPMPRPILPRERSNTDKLVEYLVGDGPQNRYALICKQCHSHNGMALKEEFEYLSFRCCYCFTLNQARRQRPFAPRLQSTPPQTRRSRPRLTEPMRPRNQSEGGSSRDSTPGRETERGRSGSLPSSKGLEKEVATKSLEKGANGDENAEARDNIKNEANEETVQLNKQ